MNDGAIPGTLSMCKYVNNYASDGDYYSVTEFIYPLPNETSLCILGANK